MALTPTLSREEREYKALPYRIFILILAPMPVEGEGVCPYWLSVMIT
jgi:hypothetical protein